MNLVPDQPGGTPSYWCTWGIQNYSLGAAIADPQAFERDAFRLAMDNLDEPLLFGQRGWATTAFDAVRPDLYLLLDVGWDVPRGTPYPQERWRLGSLEVATDRFPGCVGNPTERLAALDAQARRAGWRGAGLWVSPQVPGDTDTSQRGDVAPLAYWQERARWSRAAGIGYWKVDIGARSLTPGFRSMLSAVAREEAPSLVVEHGRNTGPLNDVAVPWESFACTGSGRFGAWDPIAHDSLAMLGFSDVFRTYDVTAQLSTATTLDRVAYLLQHASLDAGVRGLLNCEDEVYLGAALGLCLGVMRHPMWETIPNLDYDPAHLGERADEVTRAVRWQRLAPAFGAGETSIAVDERTLTDRWLFRNGETWAGFVIDTEIAQSAPAILARGAPLPTVHADGEPPFVVASRHPNGAMAVATLPRVHTSRGFWTPAADVSIEIGDATSPIGIFGIYRSLTLRLADRLEGRRIWAQDLAGTGATDITGIVRVHDTEVLLPGDLLRRIGLDAASPGDRSEPGLVLEVRG